MTSSLLPVSILGFVIVSYIALRPFSLRVRRVFDCACFLGATFILFRCQASPLPATGTAAAATPAWLHAVAAIWWLLGAWVLVAVMGFTLNHNRQWREDRPGQLTVPRSDRLSQTATMSMMNASTAR